jgi:hypothetical protein
MNTKSYAESDWNSYAVRGTSVFMNYKIRESNKTNAP